MYVLQHDPHYLVIYTVERLLVVNETHNFIKILLMFSGSFQLARSVVLISGIPLDSLLGSTLKSILLAYEIKVIVW